MRTLRVLALLSALVLPLEVSAASPEGGVEFSCGVEWLYSANFFNSHQFNYITEDGSRAHENVEIFEYTSNGGIYGHLGMNFLSRFNVSVYSGYLGIYRKRNVIPLELRGSFYPRGVHCDGPFVNLGGGIAFQEYIPVMNLSGLAHAGGGWRLALSEKVSLDFLFALQVAFDHPRILTPEGTSYVPEESVRKNNAQYLSANFGIALSF